MVVRTLQWSIQKEWTGRVRGAASPVAIVDVVVAVTEVFATAATALSPSLSLCNRGIDGVIAHEQWQPAFIH